MTKPLFALALATVAGAASAVTGLNPAGFLEVHESIASAGSGWQYTYSFKNVAASPVWWWGVYHAGGTLSGATGSYGSSSAYYTPSDVAYMGYANVGFQYDFSGLSNPASAIQPGSTKTLSFFSDVLDASPKSFFADVSGQWSGNGSLPFDTDGTQTFSYLGTTQAVPEPATMIALGMAGLALRRRRKA